MDGLTDDEPPTPGPLGGPGGGRPVDEVPADLLEPTAAVRRVRGSGWETLTREQRGLVTGLAAVLVVVLVLLMVVAVSRSGGAGRGATGTTSTTTATTAPPSTTTTVPASTTTLAVVPVTPSTTTTLAPTTTATTAVPQAPLSGESAVLIPPVVPSTRTLDPTRGCQSLADGGPWEVRCDLVRASGGTLAWMVEERDVTPGAKRARRAYVFRDTGVGSGWNLELEARDEDGSRFTAVNIRVADVSSDGFEEATFGFRNVGPAAVLSLDVVEGPGRVAAHRELARGSARVSNGQLDTWAAAFEPADQPCCPSTFLHDVIRFRDGAYRIVASEKVRPVDVPPSQL